MDFLLQIDNKIFSWVIQHLCLILESYVNHFAEAVYCM